MEVLHKLYDCIEKERILLMHYNIQNKKAATINIRSSYAIFINGKKIRNRHEEFAVLAHEYGHCKTGSTHSLMSKFDTIARHEHRANKCAIHDFLPVENIKKAFEKGYTDLWDLAEYLDMPETFVKKAYDLYVVEGKL